MKKKLILLGLILSVVLPLRVYAENPIIVDNVNDNENIESQVRDLMTPESALKSATSGTLIEGVGVKCKDGKNELTVLNDELTCANGNKSPYKKETGNGLKDFASGSTCTDNTNKYYVFGTRTYEYDCAYTGDSEENKKEFVADSSNTTNTTTKPTEKEPTKDDTNEDVETTTKATGTTENKDTGVEDYFLVLTTIGVGVIVGLYILDKKNVFTRI